MLGNFWIGVRWKIAFLIPHFERLLSPKVYIIYWYQKILQYGGILGDRRLWDRRLLIGWKPRDRGYQINEFFQIII